jgi:hypothetical protein
MPGRIIIDPRIVPLGPVAKVVFEEFQTRLGVTNVTETPSHVRTSEFDEHGREVSRSEKINSSNTKTALAYQDGRLASCVSTSYAGDGKAFGPSSWKRWSYDASGHAIEYRAGKGEVLQNHFTNFKFDSRARVSSVEYRQGKDDALLYRAEYIYRDGARKLDIIEYDANEERLRSQVRTLDEHGRIVEVEFKERDWKTKAWKAPMLVSFRYDPKDRLIEQATEPYEMGAGDQQSIPPGKVTIIYDDANHTMERTGSDGKSKMISKATVDQVGDIVALSLEANGQPVLSVAMDCIYDTRGNWTECKRWATQGSERRMTGVWRRNIVYR